MDSWSAASASLQSNLSSNWKQRPVITAMTIGGVVVLLVFLTWVLAKIVDSGSRINTVSNGVVSMTQPTTIDGGRMPQFSNGTEYGISMWIYINEPPRTNENSPILSIGGSPIFSLDKGTSNVLIKFPTYAQIPDQATVGAPDTAGGFASPPKKAGPDVHAQFDHVSMKRWVNLMAVHVDGTVTLFKDGELYSVNRIGRVDVTNPSGSIMIGQRPVDAYVSSLVFLNHFPSDKQVKRLYRAGPQSSNQLFRLMGFTNLGVRSPVYQVTD